MDRTGIWSCTRAFVLNWNIIMFVTSYLGSSELHNYWDTYYVQTWSQISLENINRNNFPPPSPLLPLFLESVSSTERKNPLWCLACMPSVSWQKTAHGAAWLSAKCCGVLFAPCQSFCHLLKFTVLPTLIHCYHLLAHDFHNESVVIAAVCLLPINK